METFRKIINACFGMGVSDLHITADHPLVCRRDGEIFFQRQHVLSARQVERLAEEIMDPRQRELLRRRWSTDLALSVDGRRVRVNVFSSQRGVSMAVRFLPCGVPDLEGLNLHSSLRDFCSLKSGLVLVCGATGSGKTTTIAALVNEINTRRACHVTTLEDPVEYLFESRRSFIEQRELGRHFHNFQGGLLDVLRQAPDVIVVGELRGPEVIQLSIDAAESGHLVIASMHAGSHEEAVHRICGPANALNHEHARMQLSQTLAAIIHQQLLFMPRLSFSVPVLSVLRNTRAIATLIREGRLAQLDGYLETCKEHGMFTMEAYRDGYLARRTDFRKPFRPDAQAPAAKEAAKDAAKGAPQSREATVSNAAAHVSRLFDYAAPDELRWDGVQAAPDHLEGLTRLTDLGDMARNARAGLTREQATPEGYIGAEIEAYISQLERRSA